MGVKTGTWLGGDQQREQRWVRVRFGQGLR